MPCSPDPTWFILVPTAVAAVCPALLLAGRGGDAADDTAQREPDEAANRLAREAAMRQIARESETVATTDPGAQPAPAAAAQPPGFQPVPVVEREPTPPEGYSFSSYREAVRVPLTDADHDGLRKPSPPGWMGGGVDALAGQGGRPGTGLDVRLGQAGPGRRCGDLAGTLAAR